MGTPLLIGIDTGGTYTDAVACRSDDLSVVASAKAPTDHADLGAGILTSLEAVLEQAGISTADIGAVAVSTTLATNALVEGAGSPVGLVAIGMDPADLERAGLDRALRGGPVLHIAGGHDSHGLEAAPLDVGRVEAWLTEVDQDHDIEGFAVAATFAVRNPAHERAIHQLLARRTGQPVTCSHHLSDQLNGPRRAVTAVLNASLVPLTTNLLDAVATSLAELGISAPLMVVKGDGSLASVDWIRERPVDTILSGPAASVTGAMHLASLEAAVVADMGGTTTDVTVVGTAADRRTSVGAVVGGHRTMVAALDIRTTGLGGDSQVDLSRDRRGTLTIGPARIVPLGVAAGRDPRVTSVLERQLARAHGKDSDGIVALAITGDHRPPNDVGEAAVLDLLASGPKALDDIAPRATTRRSVDRLVRDGVVVLAGFTPTDAAALTDPARGDHTAIDDDASRRGALLLARRLAPSGTSLDPEAVAMLTLRSTERLATGAVLAGLAEAEGLPPSIVEDSLVARHLEGADDTRLVDVTLSTAVPLIGVGGPAEMIFPAVGRHLGAEVVIPPYANVANAVGAAIGMITITRHVVISAPRRGLYRVHWGDEPPTMYDLEEAVAYAHKALGDELAQAAVTAGAAEHHIDVTWDATEADIGGRSLFVEGVVTATVSGRPVPTGSSSDE